MTDTDRAIAARRERLQVIDDSIRRVSGWCALGNVGGLAFLYNAALSGNLEFDPVTKLIGSLFLVGAVSGASSVLGYAAARTHEGQANRPWGWLVVFLMSGACLVIGLAMPIFIRMPA